MKRWIVWSFVSAATFLFGTLLVYSYLVLTAPIFTAERVIAPATQDTPAVQAPRSVEDEFNAEILDISYPESELEPSYDFNHIVESGNLEVSNHFTDIKRGERKFVMFQQDGRYHLGHSPAIFTTKRSKEPYEWLVTISFKGPGKSLFIFANLPFLRDGVIKTLYLRPTEAEIEERSLPIGYSLRQEEKRSLALGKEYYDIRMARGISSDGTKLSILILEKDTQQQIIDAVEHFSGDDHGFADILWVGDLDRDGKLDLITDGTQGTMLYVSSQAESGKLVKLVSTSGVEGC